MNGKGLVPHPIYPLAGERYRTVPPCGDSPGHLIGTGHAAQLPGTGSSGFVVGHGID